MSALRISHSGLGEDLRAASRISARCSLSLQRTEGPNTVARKEPSSFLWCAEKYQASSHYQWFDVVCCGLMHTLPGGGVFQ